MRKDVIVLRKTTIWGKPAIEIEQQTNGVLREKIGIVISRILGYKFWPTTLPPNGQFELEISEGHDTIELTHTFLTNDSEMIQKLEEETTTSEPT